MVPSLPHLAENSAQNARATQSSVQDFGVYLQSSDQGRSSAAGEGGWVTLLTIPFA